MMAIITLGAGYLSVTQFRIHSDTGSLIRQQTDWHRQMERFRETFPEYHDTTFVVVSGPSITSVNDTSQALEQQLRARPEVFADVYAPSNNPVLIDHGLLYLEPERLDDVVSRLAEAQPMLSSIARDASLGSVLDLISSALDRATRGELDTELGTSGFEEIVNTIDEFSKQFIAGQRREISLRDQLIESEDTFYNIIQVRGESEFGETLPNATVITAIENAIRDTPTPSNDIRIRLTGKVPLEHGEIVSAMESARLAAVAAIVLLSIVLVVGVRSLRVIGAVYLSMFIGLVWTSAAAPLTVGQFNTISIIFLVMFIGLGVDFAIHLCLRYQEALHSWTPHHAIIESNVQLGPALIICGVSSAIGFLAFVPTDYLGLAELGIISGIGMFIAVAISLTAIPALFAIWRPPSPMLTPITGRRLVPLIEQRRYAILAVAGALTLGAGWVAKDAHFDFSNLALRDPDSEEMSTFRELREQKVITDYAMHFIASERDEARALAKRLEAVPSVDDVLLPSDFLPQDQDEKLYILEDARFILGPLFVDLVDGRTGNEPLEKGNLDETIDDFEQSVQRYATASPDPELLGTLQSLTSSLARAEDLGILQELEAGLVSGIRKDLEWLSRAINAMRLDFEDLPADMRDRLVSDDGQFLVTILPKGDMSDPRQLDEFADQVTAIVPDATGRPVIERGVGEIVVRAFYEAIAIACAGIVIVLLVALGSIVETIAVFVPLALTALLTLATSVLFHLPLNMANVIVIPLIFGLGVDNAIHVVKRFREEGGVRHLMSSSTPRALILSTLTTLGSFGALSLSTHQGIKSIGLLLGCALSYLLVLTLVLLPAILSVLPARARPASP